MRTNRDLSATTDTPQGTRQIIPGGGTWELADSTTAAEFDFFIPESAVILKAGLRLKIRPWRSFDKDVSSGGGATSGAGGSSTPTTATQAAHSHMMFEFGGTGSTQEVAFLARTAAGNDHNCTILANALQDLYTRSADGSHAHQVTIGSHQHSTPSHVHTVVKGVHVEGSYPGAVSISLDGQAVDSVIGGPFSASAGNDVFEASLPLTSPGWHSLAADLASGLGRIQAFVVVEALVL